MPLSVYLYSLCQAINLTAAVISVAVAATVGGMLASSAFYASVPYGLQFFALLLATYPAALLMKKYGRKAGFMVGCAALFLSGVSGYMALEKQDFGLLIAAHILLGGFTACANYYRFAATDNLPQASKTKALSLVVAGGVLAGVAGPFLSSQLREVAGFALFSLCYGFFVVLAVINLVILLVLPSQAAGHAPPQEPLGPALAPEHAEPPTELTSQARSQLTLALVAAALSFGLMNLIMIQSSLHLGHMQVSFEHTSFAIQWHVVAMFLPSFFSALLIARWGHRKIIFIGFLLLMTTFTVNLLAHGYFAVVISLVLLGVGWNFCFVGGSGLLATALENNPRAQNWQGIGDTLIAVLATAGAFLPSLLLSSIGWAGSNLLALCLCLLAMLSLTR